MGRPDEIRGALSVALGSLLETPPRDGRAAPAGSRPLLLIHGFASSSRVLLALERKLRRSLGRPVHRVDLGLGLADIRSSARSVQRTLERLAAHPDFEYADVVGHSMGGLVAAYLLKVLDRGRRIRSVVTLGTPHRGTPAAWLGVLLVGAISRSIWQMLPGSRFLKRLGALPVPRGCMLVAVAAGEDGVVPPESARLGVGEGLHNAELSGADHFDLLMSRAAAQLLTQLLGVAQARGFPSGH